jgi:hypothetical protein
MWRRTSFAVLLVAPVILLAVADVLTAAPPPANQDTVKRGGKTVWAGVYTLAQSARGKAQYDSSCSSCHDTAEAPTLVGDAFLRRWFGDSLQAVLAKMRTMPADAAGSLGDAVYVDIIGYLLESSGFPAGAEELPTEPKLLENILVVEKEGSGGKVPNFSLVQAVGCLTQTAGSAWMLTHSSEPVRSRAPGDSEPADLKNMEATPLGIHSFRLLDYPIFGRQTYEGDKVLVKGFVIQEPSGDKLNVTSVQRLAERCRP